MSYPEIKDDDYFYYGILKGGDKDECEDACVAFPLNTLHCDLLIHIVLDGHGRYGRLISQVCLLTIQTLITKFAKDNYSRYFLPQEVQLFIENIIKTTCNNVVREKLLEEHNGNYVDVRGVVCDINTTELSGGTTCTVSVILTYIDDTRHVIVCNIGDSPSMVIFKDNTYEIMTTNHDASNPSEQIRINNTIIEGGSLKIVYCTSNESNPYMLDEIDFKIDPFPETVGNCTNMTQQIEWYKRHRGLRPVNVRREPSIYAVTPTGMCIANTRSIGDFNKVRYGLSHDTSSHILSFSPDDNREFIVCTFSDGISDLIFYEKFAKEIILDINSMCIVQTGNHILNKYCDLGKITYGLHGYDDACMCLSISKPSYCY
jgi:serine/threonine protein phosphatase PrpC